MRYQLAIFVIVPLLFLSQDTSGQVTLNWKNSTPMVDSSGQPADTPLATEPYQPDYDSEVPQEYVGSDFASPISEQTIAPEPAELHSATPTAPETRVVEQPQAPLTYQPSDDEFEYDEEDSEGLADVDLTSWEDRITSLEEQLEKAAKDKKKKDAEASAKSSKPTAKWTGRIHFDYWSFPNPSDGIGYFENPDTGFDPEDRLLFRRVRLGVKGDIYDTMFYKLEVDFNNPAVAEYKDVYIGWKELPNNQTLLLGNQKRPLGLDHLNSSRYNTFMERPLVVETFNPDARRIGAAFYGHTDDSLFTWRYGVYTLENTTNDGRIIGDSVQGSFNARLSSSPWYDDTSGGRGYFHWAIAGMYAEPDSEADNDTNANEGRFRTRIENRANERWLNTGRIAGIDNYSVLAVEGMLNIGAFQAVGEFQSTWTEREAGFGDELFFYGGYVGISYFLTGEHIPYDRKRGIIGRVKPFENFFLVDCCKGGLGLGRGAWQIAARYSYLDLTDGDIQGGIGSTVTAGLNWYWTPYSRLQFNYTYGDIAERSEVAGFTSGTSNSLGARFMIDF